ncbi:MAG: rane bound O-acyl transferase, family protein [Candidatus Solibacter sp.]|nr:rane bound O-acyl transferase, family protein [Candidatus Solibacter sp.]
MGLAAGSGSYFAFVAFVFFLYWAAPARLVRLGVILLANYFFCARYGLFYLALIPACGTVDFLVGLGLMRFENAAFRRALLGVSVALNLALLVGARHMGLVVNPRGWDWIFPLGLSFYALQALTYTVDLYRRDAKGTDSLLEYLSAVSFFPTLQAGPITRVTELVRQLANRHLARVDGGRAIFLIALGVLKKALVADFLAENLVNRVFDTPKLYSGAEVLLAVYGYSVQLYFDFSGYTDIARGSAQLLGVRLPINFDRPYLAGNLTEFWRRWHLSFSNWLRDYLFFALPGGRTKVMPYLNLVITMVLGGLWHGITWTFAIWGLLHGVALAATRGWWAWRGRPKQASPLAILGTYQFVCLTWIFFRAGSVGNALDILGRIGSLSVSFENVTPLFALALVLAAATFFVPKSWYSEVMERFAASPFYVHAAALALVAVTLRYFGGSASAPFVYSRF